MGMSLLLKSAVLLVPCLLFIGQMTDSQPTSGITSGTVETTTTMPQRNPVTSAATARYNSSETAYEYPPFDGFYNNYAHPEWGASETALLRLLPPAYSDGVYQPSGATRPNPIAISQIVFNGSTGHPSYKNRTAFLVFFGQQVVEEVLDAQSSGCPPEYFNIPVPKGHPEFDPEGTGKREIPLLRGRYDANTGHSPNVPREQLNEISSYIDGTLVYGPHKAWTDTIRSFKNGLLAAANDTDPAQGYFPQINTIRLPFANPSPPRDHVLKKINRFFTVGNPRGNENPFLLTFGVLWFRYHNFRARQLKANHPDWNDEKLFNEARKWVIAVHGKIILYDWLPAWLHGNSTGVLQPYTDTTYDPQTHPGIAHVFQSACMRFGHTLVTPGVYRRDANCNFRKTSFATYFANKTALRTCNAYWNGQEAVRESDIDEFLMGMASQIAEREDNIITPDLRGNVFGTLDFSRRDLMAVNIQRGRDHGLPDYNTARRFFGLPRINSFNEINTDPRVMRNQPEYAGILANLSALYNGDIDNVDIWPAGMLETTPDGPGPLFRAVITNQFMRIRNGDRFWFENYKMNGLFTAEEVDEIKKVTIYDVVMAVTNIPVGAIQMDPFFHVPGDFCPQPEQLNHSRSDQLEDCVPVQSFDYFSGSEAPYIITLVFIIFSFCPFIVILCLFARWHKRAVKREINNVHRSKKKKVPTATLR